MIDPTKRFSTRVENYVKYRPGYPREVIDLLSAECGLTPAAVVADVGSGTGILSELFLQHGNTVYGVEPNQQMRAAAERFLKDYPNFTALTARPKQPHWRTTALTLLLPGKLSIGLISSKRARNSFAF